MLSKKYFDLHIEDLTAQGHFPGYRRSGIKSCEIPYRNPYPEKFPVYGNFIGYRNFPRCVNSQGNRKVTKPDVETVDIPGDDAPQEFVF